MRSINPYHQIYSIKKDLEIGQVGLDTTIMMDEEANIWFLGGQFEDQFSTIDQDLKNSLKMQYYILKIKKKRKMLEHIVLKP